MEITIKATPKEIADLVVETQRQQSDKRFNDISKLLFAISKEHAERYNNAHQAVSFS